MNKLELISALKERTHLTKSEAAEIIRFFFNLLSDSFTKGEHVEIRGLFSFHVKNTRVIPDGIPKQGEKSSYPLKNCLSLNAERSFESEWIFSV